MSHCCSENVEFHCKLNLLRTRRAPFRRGKCETRFETRALPGRGSGECPARRLLTSRTLELQFIRWTFWGQTNVLHYFRRILDAVHLPWRGARVIANESNQRIEEFAKFVSCSRRTRQTRASTRTSPLVALPSHHSHSLPLLVSDSVFVLALFMLSRCCFGEFNRWKQKMFLSCAKIWRYVAREGCVRIATGMFSLARDIESDEYCMSMFRLSLLEHTCLRAQNVDLEAKPSPRCQRQVCVVFQLKVSTK